MSNEIKGKKGKGDIECVVCQVPVEMLGHW